MKAVNCVHNDKIWSNGFERSNLGTQCKKSGHMVLKGVICVHNDKIGQIFLKGVSSSFLSRPYDLIYHCVPN